MDADNTFLDSLGETVLTAVFEISHTHVWSAAARLGPSGRLELDASDELTTAPWRLRRVRELEPGPHNGGEFALLPRYQVRLHTYPLAFSRRLSLPRRLPVAGGTERTYFQQFNLLIDKDYGGKHSLFRCIFQPPRSRVMGAILLVPAPSMEANTWGKFLTLYVSHIKCSIKRWKRFQAVVSM